MPELPEVETVVRDLRPLLIGKRIATVRTGSKKLRRPWSRKWEAAIIGRTTIGVERRGKWIDMVLSGDLHLIVHLGMTGQLRVRPRQDPREKHTHLVLGLADEPSDLTFRDIRRFGSVTLLESSAAAADFFGRMKLGPEPFEVKSKYWRSCLASTRRSSKAILLDQRVLAGVGNIYADEALFEARLHPARPGRVLSPTEAERLRRAVRTVLKRAIQKRGSSIRDYVGGSGLRGGYQEEFRAYGRTGKPCRRCGTALVCVRLAGRATHYCPTCQTV